ncbi:TAXI family TRAP transporter solute-binding subunit [Salsuginibacillus kocurii]|uniref:TAXI family TRAP transporter solute-binding subunit n=1 Tax=Salsuginibacillus kocurii TaxID=427078 RepID=UPI000375D0FF|nr:TAXI family TRAP transporter solute-binding subunit [Salsuginibacillus kocurii]
MKSRLMLLLAMVFTLGLILVACGETPEDTDEALDDLEEEEDGLEDEDEDADEDEAEEEIGADADAGDFQLGTGSTGGTYYPLGQEMATVMNDNVDHDDFNVSAVATDASVENIAMISQGDLGLGMTVHLTAIDAVEGESDFEGAQVDNMGFMGHIYPEVMQIVALEDSGIESISDLEGADVAVGPPGSATNDASQRILEAYGLEEGDYNAFDEGFGDAADRMQDGNLDASFGLLGLPDSGIGDELANQRDITLLEVEGEALEEIEETSGYEQMTITEDDYDFLDGEVSTITAYAVLVGSTDLIDEDMGYEITKGLYENVDDVTHTQGEHLTLEDVMNGSDDLPLHPGAERFFEEEGLLD